MVKEQIKNFRKKITVPVYLKTELMSIFDEMVTPLFATEWGKRASWGALGLFVILLVTTVIEMFSGWYSDFLMTHPKLNTNRDLSSDQMMQAIAQIPEEHLFGKLGGDQGALPITSLQLHLVGIINSDPESFSRVIISESGQPGKVYGVGDSLPSGITVNSITNDGVVLENGGRLEKLPLRRTPLLFQGKPKPLLEPEE